MFRKITRTQIADLPETAVELSDNELRIVAGGLRAAPVGCGGRVGLTASALVYGQPTTYNTNGDHDPDK
jgi:hypothetical protein